MCFRNPTCTHQKGNRTAFLMRLCALYYSSQPEVKRPQPSHTMDKVLISVEELNALIKGAVNSAFDIREEEADEKKLISREAAAKRLGVDLSTLWRWDKTGYFKPDARVGRSVWYLEKSLRRLERGEREV